MISLVLCISKDQESHGVYRGDHTLQPFVPSLSLLHSPKKCCSPKDPDVYGNRRAPRGQVLHPLHEEVCRSAGAVKPRETSCRRWAGTAWPGAPPPAPRSGGDGDVQTASTQTASPSTASRASHPRRAARTAWPGAPPPAPRRRGGGVANHTHQSHPPLIAVVGIPHRVARCSATRSTKTWWRYPRGSSSPSTSSSSRRDTSPSPPTACRICRQERAKGAHGRFGYIGSSIRSIFCLQGARSASPARRPDLPPTPA